MGNKKNGQIPNITITVIFDGSALNRDEKIGGNILSIKKLTYHGEVRPFISKNAMRHYLFRTLHKANSWTETPILLQGSSDKQTMQLDLTKSDILSSKELAVFGYMFTKSGEGAITRKSPLGITKAVALSSYNQDLAFYANHDFVSRVRNAGKTAQPNPVNKEEHSGLFKVTFTIDTDKIGEDVWIVDEYSFSNGTINIKIAEPQVYTFGNCVKKYDKEENFIGYEVKKEENDKEGFLIRVEGVKVTLSNKLIGKSKDQLSLKADFADNRKKDNKGKYQSGYSFKVTEFEQDEETKNYIFECSYEPKYNEEKNTLTLKLGHEKSLEKNICNEYNKNKIENTFENEDGKIVVTSLNESKPQNGPFKVAFQMSDNNKNDIITQLLDAIKNGIIAHSSGETNTLVPLFIIVGDVKVPSPVFHSFIDVKKTNNGRFEVIGIKDALKNGWLNGNIYIQDCERLHKQNLSRDERIKDTWDEFLKAVYLEESEKNESTKN